MTTNFDKYIKNYISNSRVIPDLLLSPIPYCCDEKGELKDEIEGSIYNSDTYYQRNVDRLDFKETIFSHYLRAIRILFNGDEKLKSKDKIQQAINQERINCLIEFLLLETDKCLKNYRKLEFNTEEFAKNNPNLPKEFVKEMPYVVAYISLKRGYGIDYPAKIFDEKSRNNLLSYVCKDEYDKKTKDVDLILSIGEKIGIPYDKFLKKDDKTLI